MDILTTLHRSGGIDALARELNLLPAEAANAARCMLPAVLKGMHDAAVLHGGGAVGLRKLVDAWEELGGGGLAAGLLAGNGADQAVAAQVLDLLIGIPAEKSGLIDHCATASGLDPLETGRMLPLLAMLVAGYICARSASESNLDWLANTLAELRD